MKADVLAHGTRGDVQPYAALPLALRQAGHGGACGSGRLRAAGRAVRAGLCPRALQAFGSELLPGRPDYPRWVHTTGFWHLPAPPDWTPSSRLSGFLDASESPIYLGSGSMAGCDPQRVGRTVTEAVAHAGVRAVIVSGWGGIRLDDLPDGVLLLDQAPHGWLFPRMAAIVHHGGSGTTGAALAAGRPQVVCPFVADQPFWAVRAYAVGVTPPPQPPAQADSRQPRGSDPAGRH